jgi:hypothetical protein
MFASRVVGSDVAGKDVAVSDIMGLGVAVGGVDSQAGSNMDIKTNK